MKNLTFLAILLFLFGQAFAQESAKQTPKKLQQLYFSIGTGPAITKATRVHPNGGRFFMNVTGGTNAGTLYRLNFQTTQFVLSYNPKPDLFSYLNDNGYQPYPYKEHTSIDLAVGKSRKLNNLIQIQAMGGIGFHKITEFHYINLGFERFRATPEVIYLPGVLLQAEAMFLPSKFAGITLGGYYNLVPEISNGGLTLSLNLGMLKRN